MLQVFHMSVVKVDRDVAMLYTYVCERLFPLFHLSFRHMLQVCLSGCCICFTHMLQVFYMDVAYVCNGFQMFSDVFASGSDTCFKCFIYL
jgi:hypothetical protein